VRRSGGSTRRKRRAEELSLAQLHTVTPTFIILHRFEPVVVDILKRVENS